MWTPSPRLARGFLIAQFSVFVLAASPQESQPSNATSAPVHRALLNKYCVTCHNERLHTAGLTLEKADISSVGTEAALW